MKFTIWDNIYRVPITVMLDTNENNFSRFMSSTVTNWEDFKTGSGLYRIEDEDYMRMVLYLSLSVKEFRDSSTMIRSVSCLMHEIEHYVFSVFDFCEVLVSVDNSEHYMYHSQYIFEKIMKKIYKRKNSISKGRI